jgi:hypothetical protein
MRSQIAIFATWALGAAAQSCPANGTDTSALAKPPGMKPQNVPKGCADFEILVGKYSSDVTSGWCSDLTHNFSIARGTGEYDRNTTGSNGQVGKFGIVVGDPLVDSVVKLVPSARGYPVQV